MKKSTSIEIYLGKEIHKIRAFTRDGQGGNWAGIVPDANGLSTKQMQKIAAKVGFSETAFVQDSTKATARVRFFTINSEVGLCGHATIGTWATLYNQNIYPSGEYTQELNDGVLNVEIMDDGRVVMDQFLPKFKKKIAPEIIADVLDIPVNWITDTKLTPQIVNTGLDDVMIPIKDRVSLFAIKPDQDKVIAFQEKYDCAVHMFCLDPIDSKSITNSRNMDPINGISEEAATGAPHGAMVCYLFNQGILTKGQGEKGVFCEQGDSMGLPSQIFVTLGIDHKGKIARVRVGGYASV